MLKTNNWLFYLLNAIAYFYFKSFINTDMINFLRSLIMGTVNCLAHNNYVLISFHLVWRLSWSFPCQFHIYRRMVTNFFFLVLVQFLRPISHDNS